MSTTISAENRIQGEILALDTRISALRDVAQRSPSEVMDEQINKLVAKRSELESQIGLKPTETVQQVREEHFHEEKPEMKQIDVLYSIRGTKVINGVHYCTTATFVRDGDNKGHLVYCRDSLEKAGEEKFCELSDRTLSDEDGKQTLVEAADFFSKIGYSVQKVGL